MRQAEDEDERTNNLSLTRTAMPKKTKIAPTELTKRQPNPFNLRTVSPNGTAPKSRFQGADQVFLCAREMVDADDKRAKKRSRLYKAYKRFPPTDYSSIVELKMDDQSNVNWGMMAFIVNNNMGSFYDMVAERPMACDIVTKEGNPIERRKWSDLISVAYDQYCLRQDEEYLQNTEMDIMDMMLYGKGIEMYDDKEDYKALHCPANEFYVPEDTPITLSKWDVFMRKRSFKLNDLYKAIKNQSSAESRGWNIEAVIYAMRTLREDWRSNYSKNEDFLHDVVSGRVALSSVMKERLHVYDFYCLEYDETITRFMVLQSYQPFIDLVNEKSKANKASFEEDDIADAQGFLFMKMEYAKKVDEVVSVFVDKAGSGDWHDTPSLAEEIFVQCRQYDITMNSIMDAIKMNMTLMLQGQSEEASQRLKEVVWGQYAILPAGTPFVQQRTQLDTSQATMTLQYMMSDLYSGIGSYRVQEKDKTGDNPTATQRQLDAAESAKLKGTQISRYNERQTIFHRQRFERFIRTKSGQPGYEQFEKFREEMRENKVPDKAWKIENIKSITSNMLAGSGSPSYKMMAAEKIISFTNLVPKDEGQRAAIEDGIASLAGRAAVKRYLPEKQGPDATWKDREIGLECESFENEMLNPQNLAVYPSDDHIRHVPRHLNDMAQTVLKVEQAIKDGSITEAIARPAMTRLKNEGAHVSQHIKIVMGDQSKMPYVKEWSAQLQSLQRAIGKIQQNMQAIMEEKQKQSQQGADVSNDPDVIKATSLAQIEVSKQKQLADIEVSSRANKSQIDAENSKNKAAVDIAITRQKAAAAPPKSNGSR